MSKALENFREYLLNLLEVLPILSSEKIESSCRISGNKSYRSIRFYEENVDILLTLADVSRLIASDEVFPKFVFKERDGDNLVLALSSIIEFDNDHDDKDYEQSDEIIENILSLNSNFRFWGGIPFESDFAGKKIFLPFMELTLRKREGEGAGVETGENFHFSVSMQVLHVSHVSQETEINVDEGDANNYLFQKFKEKINEIIGAIGIITTTKDNNLNLNLNIDDSVDFSIKEIIPSKEKWRDEIINFKESARKDERFLKVVLAKRVLLESNSSRSKSINFLKIFEKIFRGSYYDGLLERSYIIIWNFDKAKYFVSVSPERLFCLKDKKIFTEAIAGTVSASASASASADELDKDFTMKDIEEHKLVVLRVEEVLDEVVGRDNWKRVGYLDRLRLKKLHHLYSRFEATIASEGKNELDNIKKLLMKMHPTPAVCGYPKNLAIRFLEQNRLFKRELYASALGYFNRECAEFAVGIRSALLVGDSDKVYLFAGAGIVRKSDPDKEWQETEEKLESIKQFIFFRKDVDYQSHYILED
ncbi:MAG: chorismate-binding protein [Oligoflexia bacterium]|nr:chorismate-binding protein [Oligoflexia bacterium]